jgi:hypothetical protein
MLSATTVDAEAIGVALCCQNREHVLIEHGRRLGADLRSRSLRIGSTDPGRDGHIVESRQLDWWVKEPREWFGRVRGKDGKQRWIKAADLRPAEL